MTSVLLLFKVHDYRHTWSFGLVALKMTGPALITCNARTIQFRKVNAPVQDVPRIQRDRWWFFCRGNGTKIFICGSLPQTHCRSCRVSMAHWPNAEDTRRGSRRDNVLSHVSNTFRSRDEMMFKCSLPGWAMQANSDVTESFIPMLDLPLCSVSLHRHIVRPHSIFS